MSVKLYTSPISPPARACTWLVNANNIQDKVEVITIDLGAKQQMEDWFVKLNPYHTVPLLHDEETGVILRESAAIIEYLVEKFNLTTYGLPTDLVGKYKFKEFLSFYAYKIKSMTRETFYPYAMPIFAPGTTADFDAIQKGITTAKTWLTIWDAELKANGGYVLGDKPTAADLYAFSEMIYFTQDAEYGFGLFNFDGFENVKAWLTKMKEVPSFKESVEGAAQFVAYAKSLSGPFTYKCD